MRDHNLVFGLCLTTLIVLLASFILQAAPASASNPLIFSRTSTGTNILAYYTFPSAPSGLTSNIINDTFIGLAWNAPSDTGGSQIIGYKIESAVGGGSYSDLISNTNSDSTSVVIRVQPGISYAYRVSAINIVGTSNPSNEVLTQASGSPTNIPFYAETKDSFGNLHRSYSPVFQFPIHTDLTKEQVDWMNMMRIHQLYRTIQILPDSNFTKPAYQSRGILLDDVTAIGNLIGNGSYHFAIRNLAELREKMDGSLGGKPADDLIIDPHAQYATALLVNSMIHVVKLTAKPSDSISKEISLPPVLLHPQPLIVAIDICSNPTLGESCGLVSSVRGGQPPYSYQWNVTYKPTGSNAQLSSLIDPTPLFVPDVAGRYQFALMVTDSSGSITTASSSLAVSKGGEGLGLTEMQFYIIIAIIIVAIVVGVIAYWYLK